MRIRNRLYFGAAISIVMVIILGVVVVLSSNQATQKAEIHNAAHAMHVTMSELDIVTYEYLLHREKRMEQQWNLIYSSTTEILEKAEEEEVALTKSIHADYASIGSLFSQVTTNYKERQELIQEGVSQEKLDAALLLEERLVAQLQIKAASIITNAAKLDQGAVADLLADQELTRNLTLILMIVFAFTVTTTSLLVARSISKPLAEVIKGTGIIGKGNLEHRIELKTKDEVGELAAAFNKMAGSLGEVTASRDELNKEIEIRKQAEEYTERLNNILKSLRNVNQLFVTERDRDSLLQKVCDALIETRGYDATWLGYLKDDRTFATVVGSGLKKNVSLFREHVLSGDYPLCVKDTLAQKNLFTVIDKSKEREVCFFKSVCTGKEAIIVRVEHAGRLFGLLAILLSPGTTVDDEEKELLKMMTYDLGLTLQAIDDEEKRKQAEEELENIFNLSSDMVGVFTTEGGLIRVNPSWEAILGYKTEELLEMGWATLVHPDDVEKTNKEVEEQLKGSPVVNFINRYKCKDGSYKTLEWRATFAKEGIVYATARDVTERKQAEEALRESEEKFSKAFHASPNIFSISTLEDGIFIDVNESFNRISGYTYDEVIGHSSIELGIWVNKAERDKILRKIKKHGGVRDEEFDLRTKSGNIRLMLFSAELITIGSEQCMIATVTDITERKQLEEERQRAAKLESVGTLAGGIAHDFNNLLTGIMGNIGLAMRAVGTGEKDRATQRLEEAEKASIRARNLTQQLLTFSRGGAPVKKSVSITELIKESASFALRGSNIRCDFNFSDGLWLVEVDEGQINQAIANLVINAEEAMPEGGVININARNIEIKERSTLPLSKGRYVLIAVVDRGVGIKKEHLDRIFEPYFTTKQKGSGLGLATSYSSIKNHGGHITVESKVGTGTTFHIYLPASNKQATSEEEIKEMESHISGEGRILVMDDEEIIREMLGDMLSLIGYEVTLTEDGAEAIEQYTKAQESGKPFGAVIMDLTIPGGMGGKEAIEKLLKIDPDAKVIVSSGYATDSIMSEYKDYGFSAVVTKPYSVAQIEKALQSLLGKKK